MSRLRLVVGKEVGGLVVVIPLLGVKTRCADKSTAEHYEIHTYIIQLWTF